MYSKVEVLEANHVSSSSSCLKILPIQSVVDWLGKKGEFFGSPFTGVRDLKVLKEFLVKCILKVQIFFVVLPTLKMALPTRHDCKQQKRLLFYAYDKAQVTLNIEACCIRRVFWQYVPFCKLQSVWLQAILYLLE